MLDILRRQADFSIKFFEKIIEFSRIENDTITLDLTPVRSLEIAEEIVVAFRIQAQQKGIHLRIGRMDTFEFNADRDILIQSVLGNILSNAIKFSYADAQVVIDFIKAPDENKGMIRVHDFGMGIPEELLPSLFEINPKKQRRGTEKEGSNGLGLYIVSQMVHLMGGDVYVNSQPNHGTIVTVEFPLGNITRDH